MVLIFDWFDSRVVNDEDETCCFEEFLDRAMHSIRVESAREAKGDVC